MYINHLVCLEETFQEQNYDNTSNDFIITLINKWQNNIASDEKEGDGADNEIATNQVSREESHPLSSECSKRSIKMERTRIINRLLSCVSKDKQYVRLLKELLNVGKEHRRDISRQCWSASAD